SGFDRSAVRGAGALPAPDDLGPIGTPPELGPTGQPAPPVEPRFGTVLPWIAAPPRWPSSVAATGQVWISVHRHIPHLDLCPPPHRSMDALEAGPRDRRCTADRLDEYSRLQPLLWDR